MALEKKVITYCCVNVMFNEETFIFIHLNASFSIFHWRLASFATASLEETNKVGMVSTLRHWPAMINTLLYFIKYSTMSV